VRTEILPSEDAQARMAPNSWGAHETELTELPFTCISILTQLKEKERTRRGMQRMLFDFRPSGAGWLLLFPDDHLAVVRARCEDMAELWVRPGNLPDGASVSGMRMYES
jgi:hypothetical protein